MRKLRGAFAGRKAGIEGTARDWLRFGHPGLISGDGGAERNRTAGLLIANEALSQLSYSPDPARR